MSKIWSGIILKTGCVIAQEENNNYSSLLKSAGIEDTAEIAMLKSAGIEDTAEIAMLTSAGIRAELLPPNDEWWTDPDTWEFNIDQDTTPDWFEADKERYLVEFRTTVKEWWKQHVLIDQTIDDLTSGYYWLKRCTVKKLWNDVKVLCDDCIIGAMYENSTIIEMRGNSTVSLMCGSSTVSKMYDNSTVSKMCGTSIVGWMFDNGTVRLMCDNSTVNEMYGSSTVGEMHDNSTVREMWDISAIKEMHGHSTVHEMHDISVVHAMYDTSIVNRMYNNSTAHNLSNGTIHVSSESKFKVVTHENTEKSKEKKEKHREENMQEPSNNLASEN